jgi:hypothetical protein
MIVRFFAKALGEPLMTCGCLSVVLWLFAIGFSILAAFDSGHTHETTVRVDEWVTALCSAILFGAFTIGSVLNEKL